MDLAIVLHYGLATLLAALVGLLAVAQLAPAQQPPPAARQLPTAALIDLERSPAAVLLEANLLAGGRANWHDQGKFDRGRQTFHWEHIVPVKAIRDACIKVKASSSEEVFVILRGIRVAWVLKSEDRELTKLGFSHNRPDPDDAYLAAKIELIVRSAIESPETKWPCL